MDREMKEKKLRVAIVGLHTSQGHLRDLNFDTLADGIDEILEKCNKELMNLVPDAEPGILIKRNSQE